PITIRLCFKELKAAFFTRILAMLAACSLAFSAVLAALWLGIRLLLRRKPVRHVHIRGRSLRSIPEVEQTLNRIRPANDPGLRIGRQLFPSQIAARHLAFVGTTGSGKTLLQRLLMQSALSQIGRGSSHRALLYDAKQDTLTILAGMRLGCP